jgi:hypothetical protein
MEAISVGVNMTGGNERLPGIYWDPREPIPPELERRLALRNDQAVDRQEQLSARHIPPELRRNTPRDIHANTQREIPQPDPRREADDIAQGELPLDDGFLPPVSISVNVQIIQDTAKVSVTQLFMNDSNCLIPRASYTFPLSHGCSVIDFRCRVGRDRILRGRVKPKEEAREAFNDAVRRNQTAGLLDQNTPEVFTTTLGNIPANARLKAEISFIVLLQYRYLQNHGLTTFTLPVYIAPRFGTPPSALQEALARTTNLRSLAVQVDVLAAEEITSITSNSHDVAVRMGSRGRPCQTWREFVETGRREDPRCAMVNLPESVTHLDKDFVLEIQTRPESGLEIPQACVETHPSLENHRAIMLTIPPNFMLRNRAEVHNGEIIFVADRSGSMSDKIEALKSAMEFFLKGIPQESHFNICSFGTSFDFLWPRPKAYSNRSLRNALSYVSRRFASDMGGTNLLPALKAVVNARGGYHSTDVIVLTDGQIWDMDETLSFVDQTRTSTEGRVRFFSLGIGTAVSHELVEGIARVGGGYAEVIPAASEGGWESRVVAVLNAALTGHIGPIRLEVENDFDAEGPGEPIGRGKLRFPLFD